MKELGETVGVVGLVVLYSILKVIMFAFWAACVIYVTTAFLDLMGFFQ